MAVDQCRMVEFGRRFRPLAGASDRFAQFASNRLGYLLSRCFGRARRSGCGTVTSFLNALEEDRNNAVQSLNQRLAALRVFFEHVGFKISPGVVDSSGPQMRPQRLPRRPYANMCAITSSVDQRAPNA
jgi:hypothetical protein